MKCSLQMGMLTHEHTPMLIPANVSMQITANGNFLSQTFEHKARFFISHRAY